MKRFFRNTWRRLTIARVRWPKDTNDCIDVSMAVLNQMHIVAIASGAIPIAEFFGSFFALLYCVPLALGILWFVPIDEDHYYESLVALRDASPGASYDSDDLG